MFYSSEKYRSSYPLQGLKRRQIKNIHRGEFVSYHRTIIMQNVLHQQSKRYRGYDYNVSDQPRNFHFKRDK